MYEVLALAIKDLRMLLRDKGAFIFAFVFPLVYAVFFGMIFAGIGKDTGSSKLQVAVVDQDKSDASAEYIESLKSMKEMDVTLTDRKEAEESVRSGNRLAFVLLPKGFGANSDGMFWGEPPNVEVGIDPSRQAESAMLQGILMKCAFERMQEMFTNPARMGPRIDQWMADIRAAKNLDPVRKAALLMALPALKTFTQNIAAADDGAATGAGAASQPAGKSEEKKQGLFEGGWQPVKIDMEPVTKQKGVQVSSYAWTFPQGIIWGVMGCAAGFGVSLVIERTNGTLVRLRMAPIAQWQILAGKAGACFVTTVAMMTALFALAAVAYGVRPESVWLLAMAEVSVAAGFVGIMMLLSVLGKTEQSAAGISWAVLLVMAMIGGGMVPRVFMPGWMLTLSQISPVMWALHAMEGALWRGLTFGQLLLPCVILVAIGAASFVVGVRAFRWTG